MNAAMDSTRQAPGATPYDYLNALDVVDRSSHTDPAVLAVEQYFAAARLQSALAEAIDEAIERGELRGVDDDPDMVEVEAEYHRRWRALEAVKPTTWQGVAGLIDVLADDAEAGLLSGDGVTNAIVLNVAVAVHQLLGQRDG